MKFEHNGRVYNNGDIHNMSYTCEIPPSVQLDTVYIAMGLFLFIVMMLQNGTAILVFNITPDDRNVSRTIHSALMSSAVLYGLAQSPVWILYLNSDRDPDPILVYTCLILLPGIFNTIFLWLSVLLAGHRTLIMLQPTNKNFWGKQLRFLRYIVVISIFCLILNIPRMISIMDDDCVFSNEYELIQQWILLVNRFICCIILGIMITFLTMKLWKHHKRRRILGARHTKYTVLESNTIVISSITLSIEATDTLLRVLQMATSARESELSVSLSVVRILRLAIYGQHFYMHIFTNFKLRLTLKSYIDRLRAHVYRFHQVNTDDVQLTEL